MFIMNERMLQRWNPFTPSVWDSPFALLRRATADMERLFDGIPAEFLSKQDSRAFKELRWTPSVDVIEKDRVLTIRVDLPGLTKDEVKVDVTGDAITVQGERKKEIQEDREGQYRLERAYGSFFRAVPLPEGVKPEDVKASFKNGVLEVTAPLSAKNVAPPTHQVQIQDGAADTKAKTAAA
jgi:HSP20 family protein